MNMSEKIPLINKFNEYINISAKELLVCNDYKTFWHNKVTELYNLIYGNKGIIK
jgi:hypothetical protein